jgi:hypothetical protein
MPTFSHAGDDFLLEVFARCLDALAHDPPGCFEGQILELPL